MFFAFDPITITVRPGGIKAAHILAIFGDFGVTVGETLAQTAVGSADARRDLGHRRAVRRTLAATLGAGLGSKTAVHAGRAAVAGLYAAGAQTAVGGAVFTLGLAGRVQ